MKNTFDQRLEEILNSDEVKGRDAWLKWAIPKIKSLFLETVEEAEKAGDQYGTLYELLKRGEVKKNK